MNKITKTDPIEELLALHLQVLTELLHKRTFDWIKTKFNRKFKQTNYLEIAQTSGLLSFDSLGQLTGAYPISPVKTSYQITVEGVGSGYAMCAIDALGAAYTFNRKTRITAIDQSTKKLLNIAVDPHEENSVHPDVIVTYKPVTKGVSAAIDQCPTIHFYSSDEDIPTDLPVEILSFREALEHAQAIFSPTGLKQCIAAGSHSPLSENCCCE